MAFLNFPLLLPAAVSSAAVSSAVLETSVDEVALSSSTAHAQEVDEEDDDIPEDWKAENHRFEEVKRCVQVVATSSGSEREDEEEEEEKVVAEEQMGQVRRKRNPFLSYHLFCLKNLMNMLLNIFEKKLAFGTSEHIVKLPKLCQIPSKTILTHSVLPFFHQDVMSVIEEVTEDEEPLSAHQDLSLLDQVKGNTVHLQHQISSSTSTSTETETEPEAEVAAVIPVVAAAAAVAVEEEEAASTTTGTTTTTSDDDDESLAEEFSGIKVRRFGDGERRGLLGKELEEQEVEERKRRIREEEERRRREKEEEIRAASAPRWGLIFLKKYTF